MLQRCLNSELIEAGCDEAGRGCLAGPVYAAAVVLPSDFESKDLNDSKQLSEKKRYALREIIEREAVCWCLGIVSPDEIDRINILNASILAMHRAVSKLQTHPEFLLIDGNRFKHLKQLPVHKLETASLAGFEEYPDFPFSCQIKGDGRFLNIAAASVLAKTYRDDCMIELHQKFPEYNWLSNKGYPTSDHREAIRRYGQTEHHRKSFRLLDDQLTLF